MTPAEAAIWAAAYGAAFAAEVREHERASDENDPIERTLNGCARVLVACGASGSQTPRSSGCASTRVALSQH